MRLNIESPLHPEGAFLFHGVVEAAYPFNAPIISS